MRTKIFKGYIRGQIGHFKVAPNLAPEITFTWPLREPLKMAFFGARNWPPKNDNFSDFAKHRLFKKKTFCCNPPFDQNLVFFFDFVLFET